MNPHEKIAAHQRTVEAAEVADGPRAPDQGKLLALGEAVVEVAGADCPPARVQEALNLLDLVEAVLKTDGEIGFDLPITGRYQVHPGVRDETPSGATLAEAVEAALAELGRA